MGQIWGLFVLLTTLQVAAAIASPDDDSVAVPYAQPKSFGPGRDPKEASTPTPWKKRQWDGPPPSDVLAFPAKVITSIGPSGTAQVLADKKTPAGGFIPFQTCLDHVTSVPILTSTIPKPTSLFPAVSVIASLNVAPSIPIKQCLETFLQIPFDHPVRRLGITAEGPIQTNKFYGNFYLGNQTSPTFLHPYSVAWARGQGASGSWGLAISHIESKQRVYGPIKPGTGAASYFINPIGIQSLCLSAKELNNGTALTTESPTDLSVLVNLRPSAQAAPAVQFPLVQGLGFITGIYNGASPVLQTGVFYRTVTHTTTDPKPGVIKYKLQLEDGTTWLVYAHHTRGSPLDLEVINNGLAQSKAPFYGIIQVAKDPGDGEKVYDQACGAYPVGVQLSGSVDGTRGTYTFSFNKAGMSGSTLAMFALPHHQSSFDACTRAKLTGLKLQTTTKGMATGVLADAWTTVEPNLPINIGFLPWLPEAGTISAISEATKRSIHNVAQQEVSQNILDQTDQNSMYFSGKALAKFASLILVIQKLLEDQGLAQAGLNQLKVAFARFSQNAQKYPLVYESGWGGVVSSATYQTGDNGVDFGNTLYNDHHFHWGYCKIRRFFCVDSLYLIYTAAVIGHLDPSWIHANKAYVDMLVRDIANPSTRDTYFPVWRAFDWFHGHSWAHGLFDVLDGKDQESSSEDTMHTYALKMWGAVSGDMNLEARSNLMLALQARSLQSYYLYNSTNTVQPREFIPNKVAGILFENKIDHTTYFGTNIEYIQGIHMLPLLPHTPFIRTPQFVREEWETYFSGGRVDSVQGGWRGILMANLATVDPRGAYAFFSRPDFQPGWLDGGQSLTWLLSYSAALGGL
ncbi:glycoside hydrolase family 81 protein [Parathielavia appendiculata]|uniref:glucan endo-1,3-beta-D-glucosidase n=1 Tax=Parathielavia appendiculata TaxID=2587402 RepID=A0AAN6U8Y3_9PEZI|nr:glycoside hydrolase family 81 protein [Parathielavia appendiculata]